ncbi:hypothetical protein L3i20_v202850 [Paenibacillus sp. L3-i20]|nr:hypothetical protein L3i20_v202850 [Paenibacillus sp. L3-i20]
MQYSTSDPIQAPATKQEVTKKFYKQLKVAIYHLLETKLIVFLDHRKYDRAGIHSIN